MGEHERDLVRWARDGRAPGSSDHEAFCQGSARAEPLVMGGGRRTAPGGLTYDHDRMGGPVTDPMVRSSHLFGTIIALGLVLATILALGFIATMAWIAADFPDPLSPTIVGRERTTKRGSHTCVTSSAPSTPTTIDCSARTATR